MARRAFYLPASQHIIISLPFPEYWLSGIVSQHSQKAHYYLTRHLQGSTTGISPTWFSVAFFEMALFHTHIPILEKEGWIENTFILLSSFLLYTKGQLSEIWQEADHRERKTMMIKWIFPCVDKRDSDVVNIVGGLKRPPCLLVLDLAAVVLYSYIHTCALPQLHRPRWFTDMGFDIAKNFDTNFLLNFQSEVVYTVCTMGPTLYKIRKV